MCKQSQTRVFRDRLAGATHVSLPLSRCRAFSSSLVFTHRHVRETSPTSLNGMFSSLYTPQSTSRPLPALVLSSAVMSLLLETPAPAQIRKSSFSAQLLSRPSRSSTTRPLRDHRVPSIHPSFLTTGPPSRSLLCFDASSLSLSVLTLARKSRSFNVARRLCNEKIPIRPACFLSSIDPKTRFAQPRPSPYLRAVMLLWSSATAVTPKTPITTCTCLSLPSTPSSFLTQKFSFHFRHGRYFEGSRLSIQVCL